jgi:hypothetical protein
MAGAVVSAFLAAGRARAHCDTLDGPVVKDARAALEKGEVTPVLKWVKPEREAEVREAFARALEARKAGGAARKSADMRFFETLVRIHREGEGASFTGLKPAGAAEPIVAAADRALEAGSVDALVRDVSSAVERGIRERFRSTIETARRKDESVEAGREYVDAYVTYVHYVEGVHATVAAEGGHHEAGGAHAGHDAARAGHDASDVLHLVLGFVAGVAVTAVVAVIVARRGKKAAA